MIGTWVLKIHRWAAVVVGVCIVVWLISGIVMVLPPITARPTPQPERLPIDLGKVALTPAEAIASANSDLGQPTAGAIGISLRRLGDATVYEVSRVDGKVRLVDAASGRLVTITTDIAETLIRSSYPGLGQTQHMRLTAASDQHLPWEPPSEAKGVFANDPEATYYVQTNGVVERRDRENVVKLVAFKLHVLEPIKLVTGRERLQLIGLMTMSILGLVVAASGYYIAGSRWFRRAPWFDRHSAFRAGSANNLVERGNS
jgi:hypothetical protein